MANDSFIDRVVELTSRE